MRTNMPILLRVGTRCAVSASSLPNDPPPWLELDCDLYLISLTGPSCPLRAACCIAAIMLYLTRWV